MVKYYTSLISIIKKLSCDSNKVKSNRAMKSRAQTVRRQEINKSQIRRTKQQAQHYSRRNITRIKSPTNRSSVNNAMQCKECHAVYMYLPGLVRQGWDSRLVLDLIGADCILCREIDDQEKSNVKEKKV
jgi:hypothetical protein